MPYKDLNKRKEYFRKYYQEHKEEKRQYQREYMRKYYLKNKDKLSKIKRAHIKKLKEKIYQKYGAKCANPNCPIPRDKLDIRCLQIDHINNNGYEDTHKRWNYLPYLRKVLADTEGKYQLLCPYCNWMKRYEKR